MRSEVSFPAMPVEPPSQERPKKRPEEDELLARVEFIKRVPREVKRFIYFLSLGALIFIYLFMFFFCFFNIRNWKKWF